MDKNPSRLRPGVVGENLLRLRKLAQLSQEALAAKAGLHRVTIASLETGRHGEPEFETIEKIAAALGIKTSELTAGRAELEQFAPLLDAFKKSPWGQIDKPGAEEEAWLLALPRSIWVNVDPNPEALHHMLLAHRASKKKDSDHRAL